jgi:ABC-type proline/glycine betaine transport system substrate-binding protein
MFVRIIAGKRRRVRIFRGTERRDAVSYNGRTLKGYVRVRRMNGETVVDTCFYAKKQKELLTVTGYDPYWLAARNSITFGTRKKAA